ncbi:hypothetical protein [uncultured Sulfitobacter sp.]|uniref:hypothetical protein n=1 Tax=uncultured Sulfitobacter sp. TaxID=191468 RepID=UPI0025947703|nr:hypothetical protein [uncultured Sulfitobacter sp.]
MKSNVGNLSDLLLDLNSPAPDSETISEAALGDLLGITANRVRVLTQEGIFKRIAPATYHRRTAVRSYCENLREHAARAGRPASNPDNAALKAENLKIAQQKAIKLELENKAKKGELIAFAEVQRAWTTLAIDLRTAIMAIPARLTTQLGLDREAQVTIESELRLALEEISDGK